VVDWRFDGLDDGDFYIIETVATLSKSVAEGEFFRVCVDIDDCAVCSLGKFTKNMSRKHRMVVMFPLSVYDEDNDGLGISNVYLRHYDGTTSRSEIKRIYLVSIQREEEECKSQRGSSPTASTRAGIGLLRLWRRFRGLFCRKC